MRSMPSTPCKWHTVEAAIEQVSNTAERKPKTLIVKRGCEGAGLKGIRTL
jgi:hypothetical protein